MVDDSDKRVEDAKSKLMKEFTSRISAKDQEILELQEEKKDAEEELKEYKEDTNMKLLKFK